MIESTSKDFIAIFYYNFRLSGISPFYDEDEDKVVASVQNCKWKFDELAFSSISAAAQDFIKNMFQRQPE